MGPSLDRIVLVAVAVTAVCSAAAAMPAVLDRAEARFAGFDHNRDGIVEIEWIRDLRLAKAATEPSRGLVLVIVEPRLLDNAATMKTRLVPVLRRFVADLAREGWQARAVAMKVYDGPVHQDGRTVLAMREYLRAVKRERPDFVGAVIVGSFPEAAVTRQYNWRVVRPVVLRDGKPDREDFGGRSVPHVHSLMELVASRAELVLADLDGRWEQLYHPTAEPMPWYYAVFPGRRPPNPDLPESEWNLAGRTRFWEMGTNSYADHFMVNDGRFTAVERPDGRLDLTLRDAERDDEVSDADRLLPNVIARPDIFISRINARGVALRPNPSMRGVSGEGLLDDQGRPQTVTFADEKSTPRGLDVWEPDPVLEQQLLVEYFERNHRYRRGEYAAVARPACAACGLGSLMGEMKEAVAAWKDFNEAGYDVAGDDASIDDVIAWLKRPAALRAICAHSDPWGASYAATKDTAALEAAAGGRAWCWFNEGNRLVPTLGKTGKLDFAVLRTLWANGVLPKGGAIYVHTGCEAIAPPGKAAVRYAEPGYGYWQGAESLLFYADGLALVGRAKIFYDHPREFIATLGAGKTVGEAWLRYYELESQAKTPEEVGGGIGRKRSYFWSVLGDWTLRLVGVG